MLPDLAVCKEACRACQFGMILGRPARNVRLVEMDAVWARKEGGRRRMGLWI